MCFVTGFVRAPHVTPYADMEVGWGMAVIFDCIDLALQRQHRQSLVIPVVYVLARADLLAALMKHDVWEVRMEAKGCTGSV